MDAGCVVQIRQLWSGDEPGLNKTARPKRLKERDDIVGEQFQFKISVNEIQRTHSLLLPIDIMLSSQLHCHF